MASENAAAVLGKASGSVYVERQGTRISLAEGDTIRATDKVITSGDATADIHFNDGSTASLSPGTTLEVKDFAFGEGTQPSFILNLAEGTMRSVSGELVKQNPEAFKIVTPQATVGIRGTELFTAVMPGGQEVHAVLHIGKGHIVSITSHDGRSIVMDSALQAVNMSDGEHGSLVKQTFQLNELQQIIKSIAPTQVQKPIQPQGVEGEVDPTQPAQVGESEAAPAASTSTVVVILHEGESATTAQVASENTATGAQAGAEGETLISIVEQLQGALADAGFSVVVAGDSTLESSQPQGKSASDALVSDTVQETVSQVIDKPADSGKTESAPDPGPVNPSPTPTPDPPVNPPVEPPVNPPVEPPVNPPVEPPVNPPVEPPVNPDPDPTPDPGAVVAQYDDIDSGSVNVANDKSVDVGQKLHVTVTGDVGAGAELIANSLLLDSAASSAGDVIIVKGALEGAVYGDTKTVSAGSDANMETFGDDSITVGSLDGGSIFGDTGEVNAGSTGTIQFGNDTIRVKGDMTGGTIYGDVNVVNSTGTAYGLLMKFGEDTITIDGNLKSGTIYGDSASSAENILGYVPEGVKDTITIKGDMQGDPLSLIVGDFGSINGGGGSFDADYLSIQGGDDVISVHGALKNGAIYGDSVDARATSSSSLPEDKNPNRYKVVCGDDEITVGSMAGGLIVGDIGTIAGGKEITLGDDTITVTGVMSGGAIHGDYISNTGNTLLNAGTGDKPAGSDTIEVGSINVAGANAAFIDGGFGEDTISIGNVIAEGSGTVTIMGGDGKDTITIERGLQLSGASEVTIDGDGTSFSSAGGDDNIAIGSANGVLTGKAITLTDSAELTIRGGAGEDKISVNGVTDITDGTLTIDGGDGIDTITLNGVQVKGGGTLTINGGDGDDAITTGDITVSASNPVTIDGGDGVDNITTGNLTVNGSGGVTISGGEGGDTITTGNITAQGSNGVTIVGGLDGDTIRTGTISTTGSANVTIDGDGGSDTITVDGYTGSSASSLTINLGADLMKDTLHLDANTLNGNITIQGYNINQGGGRDDEISISGLNVPSGKYTLIGDDKFTMELSDSTTITIIGDFNKLSADEVYTRLLSTSSL